MITPRLLRSARAVRVTPRAPSNSTIRHFSPSALRPSSAGYGDPQSEKIENHTPLPKGKKEGSKARAGHETSSQSPSTSTDGHSTGSTESSSGGGASGGKPTGSGEKGTSTPGTEEVKGQQVRETKKVGENPKNEEVGGAGVIGG